MACLCAILAAARVGAAWGESPGAPSSIESSGDVEVASRIDFIQARLDRAEAPARKWRTGWLIGFGVLTVGQGAISVITDDPGLRIDNRVGGAGSLLGFVNVLVVPMHTRSAAGELRSIPDETPEQRREKLQKAEGLLSRNAKEARLATAWWSRSLSASVPTASSLLLWLRYDRPASAALNLGAGLLIGQSQISTYPRYAIRDWSDYSGFSLRAGEDHQ